MHEVFPQKLPFGLPFFRPRVSQIEGFGLLFSFSSLRVLAVFVHINKYLLFSLMVNLTGFSPFQESLRPQFYLYFSRVSIDETK